MSTILCTPVVIPPTADHATGGELRIQAPNDIDFATLIDTINGFLIKGKAANNGNVALSPGNVAGNASVAVVTPRVDQPALIIFDASGTTTGNALSLRTSGGTEYFAVKGGTDAAAPGEVTLSGVVSLDASSGALLITGGNNISFQGLALLVSMGDSGFKLTRGVVVRASLNDTGASGTGELALGDKLGLGATGFKAPVTLSGGTIYTMPPADGSPGQVLSTDGSLNLSWGAAAQAGGAVAVTVPLAKLTGGGANGSLSFNVDGVLVAHVNPT